MCGYKSYDDCHSEMKQEHVLPIDYRVQEYAIVSEIEETYGSDVFSY